MGDFERDTGIRGAEGEYTATLSRDWEIWGPNGGYLAAIALRAVGREAKIARPVSLYVHFLSVARFGKVDVTVTPIRMGRRAEALRVAMTQEGRPVIEAMVRTAAEGPGLAHEAAGMPAVPPPAELATREEIARRKGLEGTSFPFWQNFEVRPIHEDRVGPRTEARHPEMQEWLRFVPRSTFEDPWVDAGRLALLVDTYSWPAAVQAHPATDFTAPSLDCTVWFHRSAPGCAWLLADQVSPTASGGLIGTVGRVWSESGELLASGGSQLLCIPPRKDEPG